MRNIKLSSVSVSTSAELN